MGDDTIIVDVNVPPLLVYSTLYSTVHYYVYKFYTLIPTMLPNLEQSYVKSYVTVITLPSRVNPSNLAELLGFHVKPPKRVIRVTPPRLPVG